MTGISKEAAERAIEEMRKINFGYFSVEAGFRALAEPEANPCTCEQGCEPPPKPRRMKANLGSGWLHREEHDEIVTCQMPPRCESAEPQPEPTPEERAGWAEGKTVEITDGSAGPKGSRLTLTRPDGNCGGWWAREENGWQHIVFAKTARLVDEKPRDKEIEAGDTIAVAGGTQRRLIRTVSEDTAWHDTGYVSKPHGSPIVKRPDKPGDAFRHKEHPDWKLGIWAYDAASFPLVGECERDRSKVVRVLCA